MKISELKFQTQPGTQEAPRKGGAVIARGTMSSDTSHRTHIQAWQAFSLRDEDGQHLAIPGK